VRLTHVRLLVEDFPACFRFYRDVLGFPVTFGDEEDGYADFDAGADVQLALFVRRYQAEQIGSLSEAYGDRAALIVRVEDVDTALASYGSVVRPWRANRGTDRTGASASPTCAIPTVSF
jgi:catechol 2,3-dioxygenase-like lactoylglutathione lyase family enzyme